MKLLRGSRLCVENNFMFGLKKGFSLAKKEEIISSIERKLFSTS